MVRLPPSTVLLIGQEMNLVLRSTSTTSIFLLLHHADCTWPQSHRRASADDDDALPFLLSNSLDAMPGWESADCDTCHTQFQKITTI